MNKIHIGKKIREIVDDSGITIVAFSKYINLTRDGAYKLFKKETIDTGQLLKISQVLKHDFFSYYETPTFFKNSINNNNYCATKEDLHQINLNLELLGLEIEKLRHEISAQNETAIVKQKIQKTK